MDNNIIPLFIAIIIIVGVIQFFRREQAKDAYEQSLNELETHPNDSSLRKQTMKLGRSYSKMTRNKYGVPSYNESAVMDDIQNATETSVNIPVAKSISEKPALEYRLRRLDMLRDENLISNDEYKSKRAQILAEV